MYKNVFCGSFLIFFFLFLRKKVSIFFGLGIFISKLYNTLWKLWKFTSNHVFCNFYGKSVTFTFCQKRVRVNFRNFHTVYEQPNIFSYCFLQALKSKKTCSWKRYPILNEILLRALTIGISCKFTTLQSDPQSYKGYHFAFTILRDKYSIYYLMLLLLCDSVKSKIKCGISNFLHT